MARKAKEDFEDDGRTVADMSEVSRPPLIIPRIPGLERKKAAPENRVELTKDQARSTVFAAILAGTTVQGALKLKLTTFCGPQSYR